MEKQFDLNFIATEELKTSITNEIRRRRSYNIPEQFLVQEFNKKEDAEKIRNIVRANLGSLSPAILTPFQAGGSTTWYLAIVKPSSTSGIPQELLFQERTFGDGVAQPILLTDMYKSIIRDIFTSVLVLLETEVRCKIDKKSIYLCGVGDIKTAKFVEFYEKKVSSSDRRSEISELANNLTTLFQSINLDIRGAPAKEFDLFYKFLNKYDFGDINMIYKQVIFWSTDRRRDLFNTLHGMFSGMKYENYYPIANAIEDWETKVNDHPDLKALNDTNQIIEDEIAQKMIEDGRVPAVDWLTNTQEQIKNCIGLIRHVFEHNYKMVLRGNLKLQELDIENDASFVEIMQYYFPDLLAATVDLLMLKGVSWSHMKAFRTD